MSKRANPFAPASAAGKNSSDADAEAQELFGDGISNSSSSDPEDEIDDFDEGFTREDLKDASAAPSRARGGCRPCNLTEMCRSEGLFMRNEDAPMQVEMYLVCSVTTILLIRVGLYATGYPQLGGNGIHIAHMLWGGLLMFVSQMMSFAFLGRHIQRLASVVGGIGFGAFIDELGKFITSDNNYFFKPTPFLLYIGFCAFFVLLKCIEPAFKPKRFTEAENLANALNLLSVYSTAGLSKESKLVLIELLEHSARNHPIVEPLKMYMQRPTSSSGISLSREHYYLRFRRWISQLYVKLVRSPYTTYILNGFFVVQCATQIFELVYLVMDGSYYYAAIGHNITQGVHTGKGNMIVVDPANLPRKNKDEGFWDHLVASSPMKIVREISSGQFSDELLKGEEAKSVTTLHVFQFLAVVLSALCVIMGVYSLSFSCGHRCSRSSGGSLTTVIPLNDIRRARRKTAFVWFRRSMMVRLFITDSLSLLHSQFTAFGDVVFTLFVVAALTFMITQEESTERLRRLSTSGSIDQREVRAFVNL